MTTFISKTIEVIIFDILSPIGCIAVKGRKGLREVISRREEEKERQKEAASKEPSKEERE